MTNIDPNQVRRVLHEVVDIFASEIHPLLPLLDQWALPIAVNRLHNGIDRMGNEVVLQRIVTRLAVAAKRDKWFRSVIVKELGLEE